MRSSCNLGCFTLIDGLLTDALGLSSRDVLVHHVSVARLALSVLPTHGFAETPARRRMLLESAGAAGLRDSVPDASAMLGINPAPRTDTVEELADHDVDGPHNYVAAFFPIYSVFNFSCIGAAGLCCCSAS